MTVAPRLRLAELRLALLFLTRLPAGQLAEPAPSIGASAWAWPLVGALVGAAAAVVHLGALAIGLSPVLAAWLALAAAVLVTGGLHEDGLADLADGFGGGHDKARKLEIMRDSRIGSYGVLALILALGLKAGALAHLGGGGAVALIALGAGSRAALPWMLNALPPARSDGLGRAAIDIGRRRVLAALALGTLGLGLLGWAMIPVAIAMLAACAGLAGLARRQIGGMTGDVAGATQQVAEIAGWLVLVALI